MPKDRSDDSDGTVVLEERTVVGVRGLPFALGADNPAPPTDAACPPAPMWKIGDVVVLMSGSPALTVVEPPSEGRPLVTCQWWDGGRFTLEKFNPGTLRRDTAQDGWERRRAAHEASARGSVFAEEEPEEDEGG
ncbi:MAG TPA: hypothetical protein VF526_15370 [Solirubrobacteraceae bacterium]|jgi:uncharacterized protein YodC (DUF2158 family)